MKSDITVTKGFFKKVELSKNIDKCYSKAIDDLRNVKKHFRHPLTLKSIDNLLMFLENDHKKPFEQRASDEIYAKRQDKLNFVLSQDILKKLLDELMYIMEGLKQSFFILNISNIGINHDPHFLEKGNNKTHFIKQNELAKNLFANLFNNLKRFKNLVDENKSHYNLKTVEEFEFWLKHENIEFPHVLINRNKYMQWKNKLYLSISEELNHEYFSWF